MKHNKSFYSNSNIIILSFKHLKTLSQLTELTSLLEIFARFRILKQTHQRLLARSHQNKSSKHLPHSLKEVSHYLCFAHTSNGKGFREGTYIEHDRAPPSKRNIMIRLF